MFRLSSLQLGLLTLWRKLGRSFTQRGARATLRKCISQPLKFLRQLLVECGPARLQRRREEIEFDRTYGVETRRDNDLGWMARITSDNWRYGIGYAPAPIGATRDALRDLPIDHSGYAFIDFGAGKGRVLLLASEFPFQEIVGVEYSPRLCEIARRNIAVYRNNCQRCPRVSVVEVDAVCFPLPPTPCVLFFHHPFEAPVFRQVIAGIEKSWRESPREMLVIYFDPRCGDLFDNSAFFSRRSSTPLSDPQNIEVAQYSAPASNPAPSSTIALTEQVL